MKKRGHHDARLDLAAEQVGRRVSTVIPRAPSRALSALRAIADAPPVARLPEEFVRLVDAERSSWGRTRTPDEAATLANLRKLVGSPDPAAYNSADAYAIGFAAWLAESDWRLAGEAGRGNPLDDREEAGSADVDGGEGHTP